MTTMKNFASPSFQQVAAFRDQEERRVAALNRQGMHLEILQMNIEPSLLGKLRYKDGFMNYMEIPVNGEGPEAAYQQFCQEVSANFPAVESQHQGYVLHMVVD